MGEPHHETTGVCSGYLGVETPCLNTAKCILISKAITTSPSLVDV